MKYYTLHRNKLFVSFILILLVWVGMLPSQAAADDVNNKYCLAEDFIDRQLQSLVKGEVIDFSDLVCASENINAYGQYIEWRKEMAVQLNTKYSSYEFQIENFNLDPSGITATAILDVSYTYANGAGNGGYWNCPITFCFSTDAGVSKISAFYSEEEIYSDYFDQINFLISNGHTYDNSYSEMLDILESRAEEIREASFNVSAEDLLPHDDLNATGSCAYSTGNGVAYARKYVTNSNTNCFSYISGADCTNFVSQCIWAAYGGWSNGSESTMQQIISSRKYMMDSSTMNNWFGHSNGSGNPWQQVEGLWNLATSSPSYGPKATGKNNNGYYTGISCSRIYPGDVLQFRAENDSEYKHSTYVISNSEIPSESYSGILVAQHSDNAIYTVAEKVVARPYMRQMTFTSATLNT